MDTITLQFMIAGAVFVPLFSLVRRYWKIDSELASKVALWVCVAIVAGVQFLEAKPELLEIVMDLVTRFTVIYATAQTLYDKVFKDYQWDRMIEGKKLLKK